MASYTGGGSNGPDYVQPGEPADPDPLETWYDTDADPDGDGTEQGEYLIYGTDGSWHSTTVQSHRALRDVVEDAHHNPVSVEGPLRLSSGQVLDLAAADGLTLDADGRLRVAAGSVTQSMLAFDVAAQGDLNNHTSDTSNPHNVTDDQTGAAAALNNHASDADAHHSHGGLFVAMSANQTAPENTRVTLALDSVEFDDFGNSFDTSTHTFNVPENGLYLLSIHVEVETPFSASNSLNVYTHVNGGEVRLSSTYPNDIGGGELSQTEVVPLSAGDSVTIRLSQYASGDKTITGAYGGTTLGIAKVS